MGNVELIMLSGFEPTADELRTHAQASRYLAEK
jgi:hypothetical protein